MKFHIPTIVYYQALNLGILIVALSFLLRKKVRDYFSGRHTKFEEAVGRVERIKAEAEERSQQIKLRLERLEQASGSDLDRAKTEAAELRIRIVAEAEEAAAKLQKETIRTIDAEAARAALELREEALKQAIEFSKNVLQKNIQAQDQERLNKEFVEKIQVVH